MMDNTRKIEQIAAINQLMESDEGSKENYLVVVARCNDGTVWTISPNEFRSSWHQLPDIPQPDPNGDKS